MVIYFANHCSDFIGEGGTDEHDGLADVVGGDATYARGGDEDGGDAGRAKYYVCCCYCCCSNSDSVSTKMYRFPSL